MHHPTRRAPAPERQRHAWALDCVRRLTEPLALLLALGCAAEPTAEPEPAYVVASDADPSVELYAERNLVRLDLELPPESLTRLRNDPREYAPGTLRYRDRVVENVGIRLKGESSFRELDDKPAFKLKFNEFVKGQRFAGLKRMTLNNDVQDPSSLSQSLAYRAFRAAGLPAPRCNHALVYVNGEYYGLYSNVETEDETFLARWFEDPEGNLYEEAGVDFVPGASESFDLETNERENDRSDLEALIEAVQAATPEDFVEVVGRELDLDAYLRFAALEALTGGEDGYSYVLGSPNNFRLYRDPGAQRFAFLPWGLDRALRPRFDPELVHDWLPPLYDYRSAWDTRAVLLRGCLESPACQGAYSSQLAEMAQLFESLELDAEARAHSELIRDAVRADLRKPADDAYAEYSRQLLIEYVQERPEALRAELAAR